MLDYLYQIENLFNDVEILKTTAVIFGIAIAILLIIVISQSYNIKRIEKILYDIKKYNFTDY